MAEKDSNGSPLQDKNGFPLQHMDEVEESSDINTENRDRVLHEQEYQHGNIEEQVEGGVRDTSGSVAVEKTAVTLRELIHDYVDYIVQNDVDVTKLPDQDVDLAQGTDQGSVISRFSKHVSVEKMAASVVMLDDKYVVSVVKDAVCNSRSGSVDVELISQSFLNLVRGYVYDIIQTSLRSEESRSVDNEQMSKDVHSLVYSYVYEIVQTAITDVVHDEVFNDIRQSIHDMDNIDVPENKMCMYVDSILNVYRRNSHKSLDYFNLVRSLLAKDKVMAELDELVENFGETGDCIKNIIDDILHDLSENDIPVRSLLTASETKFADEIVADCIFKQKFISQIRNATLVEKRHSVQRDRKSPSGAHQSPDALPVETTVSLASTEVDTSAVGNDDLKPAAMVTCNRIISDAQSYLRSTFDSDTSTLIMGQTQGRYLPRFSPYSDPNTYVCIPPIHRLPKYIKTPLARITEDETITRKYSIDSYTKIMAPTFHLHQDVSQIHSKLTKHYNHLK